MEWKGGIITLTLLTSLICVLSYSTLPDDLTRSKRIIFGDLLPSHDIYQTQFFINIRSYTASTNFKAVKLHVPDNTSTHGEQICGGALVHPEYAITAAHCCSWTEVRARNIIELDEEDAEELRKAVVLIKKFDVILSTYVLYAGGTGWFNMTQRRHVRQIFPHIASDYASDKYKDNDVAFLRACFPFNLDGANVAVAPMDIDNSRIRFYDLTKKGAVCLFMGFGFAGWNEWDDENTRWNKFWVHDLRHGWSYLNCATSCPEYKSRRKHLGQNCAICALNLFGLRWHVGTTDSGGPFVCDGLLTGISNEGTPLNLLDIDDFKFEFGHINGFLAANQSETWFYALHCIKDYLTESHFKYLSEISPGPDESRVHAEWTPFNPALDLRTTRRRRIKPASAVIG